MPIITINVTLKIYFMKRILSILVLTVSTTAVFAQAPTINASNYFKVGKWYPYKLTLDSVLWKMSPGNGGANVVWDYSAIKWVDYLCIDTTYALNPVGTPKFATCSISATDTANICLLNKSPLYSRTDDYHYYKVGNGKIIETGYDQDNGVVEDIQFQFSNSMLEGLLPFTYLTSNTNLFTGTYYSHLDGIHTITGTDTIIADGYGILKIDNAMYENCIRLKHIQCKTDSNQIRGIHVTKNIKYTWYSQSKEGPVLIMEQDASPNTYKNGYFSASYYYPAKNTQVPVNTSVGVSFYPNPTTDYLYVSFNEKPVKSSISINNSLGQQVLEETLAGNVNGINVSAFQPGVYNYILINNGILLRGVFVKQ